MGIGICPACLPSTSTSTAREAGLYTWPTQHRHAKRTPEVRGVRPTAVPIKRVGTTGSQFRSWVHQENADAVDHRMLGVMRCDCRVTNLRPHTSTHKTNHAPCASSRLTRPTYPVPWAPAVHTMRDTDRHVLSMGESRMSRRNEDADTRTHHQIPVFLGPQTLCRIGTLALGRGHRRHTLLGLD